MWEVHLTFYHTRLTGYKFCHGDDTLSRPTYKESIYQDEKTHGLNDIISLQLH